MLDKVMRMGQLYDFYGALLTEKQQHCLELHFLHDESLAEIAEVYHVSRQAIHDMLQRSEQILLDYENKMGLVARYSKERALVAQVLSLLGGLPIELQQTKDIHLAVELLQKVFD